MNYPQAEFSIRVPAQASSLRVLRSFAANALALTGSKANEGETVLVVSELATNAIQAGENSTVKLNLQIDAGQLRIELEDSRRGSPTRRDGPVDRASGRGLAIVDQLANHWGWTLTDGGKTVWAEFRLPSP